MRESENLSRCAAIYPDGGAGALMKNTGSYTGKAEILSSSLHAEAIMRTDVHPERMSPGEFVYLTFEYLTEVNRKICFLMKRTEPWWNAAEERFL